MADRNIIVRLKAEVSGFQAAMAAASASTRKAEDDLVRYSENGSTSLGRMVVSADEHRQAWTDSGTALLGFGAAAVAGVALAVKAFADYDAKMAQVQSLTHAGATDMEGLRQAALTVGQNIGFSAEQVADAEIEMAKAGIAVKDQLGGALVGTLTLAAAGQIQVAQATEIATIAMTQFGLAGKDIPHLADLLAAGADKALGGVSELGWALKSGGLVAHQFGLSIEETIGTLALFAQNGLMGEAAGTDLRQMLLKLAAPSKTAAADMKNLGIVLYDSSGHFVGITALAGELHEKMKNLTEAERNAAMAHIFGARSIVGANILYQAGADGVQQWVNAVNDSGFAAKQAAGKMDSLNGDMQKLGAAWTHVMIEAGSTANGFLRPVVQTATDVLQAFEQLPEPVKGAGLGFAAAAGGAALLVGGFLTLAPKVFDTIQGFQQLAKDGVDVQGKLGGIAKAAAATAIALTAVTVATEAFTNRAKPSVEDMTQSMIDLNKTSQTTSLDGIFTKWDSSFGSGPSERIHDLTGAVKELTNPHIAAGLQNFADALTFGGTLGAKSDLGQVTDRFKDMSETMGNLVTSGNADIAARSFNQVAAAFEANGKSAQDALDALPGYKKGLQDLANQQGINLTDTELLQMATGLMPDKFKAAADSTQSYVDSLGSMHTVDKETVKALKDMGLAIDGTVESMGKLIGAFEKAGLAQISADEALVKYHEAVDKVTESIDKNGSTLDLNTKAGQANQTAFDDLASAGLKVVEANAKNGDSQEDLSGKLKSTYDDLVNVAVNGFHLTGDKADEMARKVLGIPKDVEINTAIQNYIDTQLKLAGINDKADALNGKKVNIIIGYTETGTEIYDRAASSGSLTGPARAFATGGAIEGAQLGFASGGSVHGPAHPYVPHPRPHHAYVAHPRQAHAYVPHPRQKHPYVPHPRQKHGKAAGGGGGGGGGFHLDTEMSAFAFASGGVVGGFPWGGLLRGPGGGTSDSMLARVSNGEYIMPAARVKQYGVAMLEQMRAGRYKPAAPAYQPSPSYISAQLHGGGGRSIDASTNFNAPVYTVDLDALNRKSETARRDALATMGVFG